MPEEASAPVRRGPRGSRPWAPATINRNSAKTSSATLRGRSVLGSGVASLRPAQGPECEELRQAASVYEQLSGDVLSKHYCAFCMARWRRLISPNAAVQRRDDQRI